MQNEARVSSWFYMRCCVFKSSY